MRRRGGPQGSVPGADKGRGFQGGTDCRGQGDQQEAARGAARRELEGGGRQAWGPALMSVAHPRSTSSQTAWPAGRDALTTGSGLPASRGEQVYIVLSMLNPWSKK